MQRKSRNGAVRKENDNASQRISCRSESDKRLIDDT